MSLRRISQNNAYIAVPFQGTATTVAVDIGQVIPDLKRVNETIFSRNDEWQSLLNKQAQAERAEQNAYDKDLAVNGDTETFLAGESADDSIAECRMPTELELQQARLMNIPTRGFCVSADLEKINADSYRYLYDPEEFAPPDID